MSIELALTRTTRKSRACFRSSSNYDVELCRCNANTQVEMSRPRYRGLLAEMSRAADSAKGRSPRDVLSISTCYDTTASVQ